MNPDLGFYPYGWLPHTGVDDGSDYMQMQQAMAMDMGGYDMGLQGPGLGLAGGLGAQAMQFNHPSLDPPQLGGARADTLMFGSDPFMGSEMDAFAVERGMPIRYGGGFDGSMPYGYPGMPYAHEGSGLNAMEGLAHDPGLPRRSRFQDFPQAPGYPSEIRGNIHNWDRDAAWEEGLFRGGPHAEFDIARYQAQAMEDRGFNLGPYGPYGAYELPDAPPGEFTREQFMQERLPMEPAWQRALSMRTPLPSNNQRYPERGMVYEPPTILNEQGRRVHFA